MLRTPLQCRQSWSLAANSGVCCLGPWLFVGWCLWPCLSRNQAGWHALPTDGAVRVIGCWPCTSLHALCLGNFLGLPRFSLWRATAWIPWKPEVAVSCPNGAKRVTAASLSKSFFSRMIWHMRNDICEHFRECSGLAISSNIANCSILMCAGWQRGVDAAPTWANAPLEARTHHFPRASQTAAAAPVIVPTSCHRISSNRKRFCLRGSRSRNCRWCCGCCQW